MEGARAAYPHIIIHIVIVAAIDLASVFLFSLVLFFIHGKEGSLKKNNNNNKVLPESKRWGRTEKTRRCDEHRKEGRKEEEVQKQHKRMCEPKQWWMFTAIGMDLQRNHWKPNSESPESDEWDIHTVHDLIESKIRCIRRRESTAQPTSWEGRTYGGRIYARIYVGRDG
jgi:hypothetical protein